MAEACRDWRGDVAALALGRHEGDAYTRTLAHLDGCVSCRDALDELRVTARALPVADLTRIGTEPAPARDLAERITHEVHATRVRERARRRRRVAAAASALAIAAAAVFFVVGGAGSSGGGQPLREFAVSARGVDGSFSLQANGHGTAVHFVQHGLDPGDTYWLWLTDGTGKRVSAGTFMGTGDGKPLTLQAALPRARAVRIWVTDASDSVLLDSPVQPAS